MPVALFGHGAEPALAALVRRHAADRFAFDEYCLRIGRHFAIKCEHEFGLPVPGHPGDAEDFACPHAEGDVRQ